MTYDELRSQAARVAGALRELGVRRGDVVGLLLHNSREFVALMLGAAYLGAVFMPLNWRLAPPEIAYIVNHSGAVVLVSEPELDPLVAPVQRELDCRNLVRIGPVDDGPWISFDAVCDASDPLPGAVAMRPDDLLRLMYTSGTTSRPKGVMITCGNLDAKCLAHCVELGFTQDDRGLIAGPLYHVGALDLTFTTLLYVGAFQRVLRSFDARAVLSHIEAERITTVWLAPVMVKLVLEESASSHHDLSSLRVLIDGGEKMPLPLIDGILATFPHAWFADAYGLTETVSGDTFLDKGKERSKLGSVGRPVFNVDVQIMGPDGTVVPPGEDGEIVLRGPKVFSGYWRDPEATAAALRDGWFHTGDVGMLDSDGYVYVIDRLKDMILSGGENISSLEVERVLYEHPRVVEAAVVGRPHSRWGEVPVAYVVARDADLDVDELIEFCVLRLARFKVPKAVRVVASLPRNPSGKVLKRLLRESESQTAAEVPDPS